MTDRTRFGQKLKEQIAFIQRSCAAFDSGAEEEALRIATAMRVIFHDTKTSTSLVKHLSLTNESMFSSSRGIGNFEDYLSFRINFSSPEPVTMVPLLGEKFRKLTMVDWWSKEPVFVHEGEKYSRRLIVLSAANRDGGAHVDEKLEHYYEVLCEGKYGCGITGNFTFNGAVPFKQGVTHYAKNAHLALIRQFAHETLVSVSRFRLPVK